MDDQARRRRVPGRRTVFDCNGCEVGLVRHVYYDAVTGRPEWLGVSTGWFRAKEHLVPAPDTFDVAQAQVIVDYDVALINQAPHISRRALEDVAEKALYTHYGFEPPSRRRFRTLRALTTPTWPLPSRSVKLGGLGGSGGPSLRSRWLGRVAYGEATDLQQALLDSNRG